MFLKKIQYDEVLSKSICRAVAIHDRVDDIPADATPFELSVRDADVAPALEEAKYCAEKKELRALFTKLIASCLNKEKCNNIQGREYAINFNGL